MKRILTMSLWLLFLPSVTYAANIKIELQASPDTVVAGGTSTIGVRVTADGVPASPKVHVQLIDGSACGTLDRYDFPDIATDGTGQVHFTADAYARNCRATIKVFTDPATDTATQATTTISINPAHTEIGRIDGLGAIAVVLIVSFAIDRLIRGLFFLLSYWKPWARRFPDPELDGGKRSPKVERNRRLIYVALAAVLGMVTLAWFGRIRLLAALGFTGVNPLLDVLITGLILVGGADRTDQLLQAIGGGSGAASETHAKPLEITGKLIVEEQPGKRSSEN